jgi:hypothetical protein
MLPEAVVNCLAAAAKSKNKLPKDLVRDDLNPFLISLVEQNLLQAFPADKTLGDLARAATKAPARPYGVSQQDKATELQPSQAITVLWRASTPVNLVVESPLPEAGDLESFDMELSLSEILPIGWGVTLPELVARRLAAPNQTLTELLPSSQEHFINIAMHALAEADGTMVEELPAGVDMVSLAPAEPEESPDSCPEEWQLWHRLQAAMVPVVRGEVIPVVRAETVTARIRGIQLTHEETEIIYAETLHKLETYLQVLAIATEYGQALAWQMKEE